jgi:hypothetical protein
MHRVSADRWLARQDLVTDDLGWMLWSKLKERGRAVGTSKITCEWVNHPAQRHKLLREPEGGLNPYRAKFEVKHPLRFHTSIGNLIDEEKHYRRFRERPLTLAAPDGLKILIVGELAYNAERILALEERGHKLYGLWMRNWQAVPFAHEVLTHNPGIPMALQGGTVHLPGARLVGQAHSPLYPIRRADLRESRNARLVYDRPSGSLRGANWDDLNYPARISTLAAAGLPMLQRDNTGHIVATQTLAERLGISVFFKTFEELGAKLRDEVQMARIRESVWARREVFMFDHHADRLIGFFRKIINTKQ